jgi:hypothetical protein
VETLTFHSQPPATDRPRGLDTENFVEMVWWLGFKDDFNFSAAKVVVGQEDRQIASRTDLFFLEVIDTLPSIPNLNLPP